jgi:hypothetical protein
MRSLQEVVNEARLDHSEIRDREVRKSVEVLIDEMAEQSFPASDPPTWGTVSTRLAHAARPSPTHISDKIAMATASMRTPAGNHLVEEEGR